MADFGSKMRWLRIILLGGLLLWGSVAANADPGGDPVVIMTVSAIVPAPPGLTLTYISDYEVKIDWELPDDAVATMIKCCVGRYPESRDEGYTLYYGDAITATDTGVSLDETFAAVYYRAWYQDGEDNWLPLVSEANIEGPGMTLLAEALNEIKDMLSSNLMLIIQITVAVSLVVLAYWHRDRLLYIAAGLALIALAISYMDSSWALGTLLVLAGVYSIIKAVLERGKA